MGNRFADFVCGFTKQECRLLVGLDFASLRMRASIVKVQSLYGFIGDNKLALILTALSIAEKF